MKKITTILTCFIALQSWSQETFDWATAGQTMSMEYTDLEAHPNGGVVALAEKGQLNFISEDIIFLEGDGSKTSEWILNSNQSGHLLMYFNKEGKVDWLRLINYEYAQASSFSIGPDGSVYLLAFVDYYDEDAEGREFGYLGSLDDDSYEEVEVGYHILKFSSDGRFLENTYLQNINYQIDLEVHDFKVYNNNQFLISGFIEEGKFVENFDVTTQRGGGHLVLMVNSKGVPVWSDVVSNRKNSCCTLHSSSMDFAPDGTIYLGGTYDIGGIFSNGQETMAPGNFDEKQPRSTEAYVVSYSPKGKINWISVDESQSRLQSLVATDDGVFIAHSIQGPKAFGEKVDTVGVRNTVISFINSKGKTRWNEIVNAQSVHDMDIDNNGNVVVTGLYKNIVSRNDEPAQFGSFAMKKGAELFAVTINSAGKYVGLWSADLNSSNDYINLAISDDGAVFLAFEAWCTLSLQLTMIDKSLPDLKCYGGSPILGKINW